MPISVSEYITHVFTRVHIFLEYLPPSKALGAVVDEMEWGDVEGCCVREIVLLANALPIMNRDQNRIVACIARAWDAGVEEWATHNATKGMRTCLYRVGWAFKTFGSTSTPQFEDNVYTWNALGGANIAMRVWGHVRGTYVRYAWACAPDIWDLLKAVDSRIPPQYNPFLDAKLWALIRSELAKGRFVYDVHARETLTTDTADELFQE